jgi:HEAT repeat protein
MFPAKVGQSTNKVNDLNVYQVFPIAVVDYLDPSVEKYLSQLSPETPWGDRQIAAKRLGSLRSNAALPGLLSALLSDNFWMVRCSIIQALEKIGDPGAIQVLEEVAKSDGFQVVRSYATKAIERLS